MSCQVMSIGTVLQKENVTRAEIVWVLEILLNNYSYRSCIRNEQLFVCFQIVLLPRNFNWVNMFGQAPFLS